MTRHLLLPLGAMIIGAVACGDTAQDPGTGPNVEPETVSSSLQRDLTPNPTPAEMAALADGNHALTLELYQATAKAGENYMISTLSIRTAFAMLYAGARTTTAQEIADVMRFDTDQDRFHQAMNALDLTLSSRELAADPANDLEALELRQANAFWSQIGYTWRSSYLDRLAINYGAGVKVLDFTQPEVSRQVINGWVESKTNDRIEDLLPEGAIVPGTVAVLTNAVYFKAPWLSPFLDSATGPGDFTRADGTTTTADFMQQIADYSYAKGTGWTAVELPYRGEELSMVLIVPDAGTFSTFDSSLTAQQISDAVDALAPAKVELALPKFEFRTGFTLKKALMDLGMIETFTLADLSGMVENAELLVDEAYHQTFVAVDESGTEAAAATAIVVVETSVPIADVTLTVDRPFYFLIRDRDTNVWLFFGRVLDP